MKKLLLFVPIWLFLDTVYADDNLLWLGYSQNNTDFFESGTAIKPDGVMFGISTAISERFLLTLSYADLKGKSTETVLNIEQLSIMNTGETQAQSIGASLSWVGDDYGLTFSYGKIDNQENSTTRFPLIVEEIDGDDDVLSLSFDKFIPYERINLGWSVGTQYVDSEVTLIDVINIDPITVINAQFDSESWSAFIDLDFSIPVEYETFTMTPLVTLSWNWELSNTGDQLLTIFRNGERLRTNNLSDRLATTFRTPDSGFWELAVEFEWSEKWGATLSYGQTISADTDVDSISFDISVAF